MASYTQLRYHIVTATYGRRPLITPDLEHIIFGKLHAKARECGGRILAVGGIEDHIHMVVAIPAAIALADFVREVKTASSRAVRKAHRLDEPFRWQSGYGAFTAYPTQLEPLIRYVRAQKYLHSKRKTRPALERTSR